MKDFLKKNSDIIFTCIFVIIVALLGSIFVSLGKDWFASLLKPSQWLSDFVISLLWSVIYILFAVIISVLFKKELITKKIIVLAVLNGILNVLWCLVFFYFKSSLFRKYSYYNQCFFCSAFYSRTC